MIEKMFYLNLLIFLSLSLFITVNKGIKINGRWMYYTLKCLPYAMLLTIIFGFQYIKHILVI